MQPNVRMLLSVRQLLNDTSNDVATISLLTSLVLAIAESLQRVGRVSRRALARYADVSASAGGHAPDGHDWRPVTPSDDRALVPVRGQDYLGSDVDDDDRLTLMAIECCDAAYRQIQSCGARLDQKIPSSSIYGRQGHVDYDDDDLQARLLTKVIQLCYVLGAFIRKISRSAKDGLIDDFCESVHRFAAAVSRILVIIPQMRDSDVSRLRSLWLSGRAIRHCASSLVSSARMMAAQRHQSAPYQSYAEHSRALSRALTHLAYHLSIQPDPSHVYSR